MGGEARSCPFCGAREGLSKEHVWPQWLRVAPGAQSLLDNSPRGRRSRHVEPVIVLGSDGHYQADTEKRPYLQNLLPEVQIPVCGQCNNGWMNQLEGAVQPILQPFLIEAQPIIATPQGRTALAVWALKTFMTYALTKGSQTNPFRDEDYRRLREDRAVPAGVRIWILTSHSRWSHVGLMINSWSTMLDRTFEPDTDPDNCALGFLAVGGAVFVVAKTLPQLPEFSRVLVPPVPTGGKVIHELTGPRPKPLRLEPCQLGEEYMDELDKWFYLPKQIAGA